MKIEKLKTEDRAVVLDRLRGHVFHMTTLEAYRQIELAGEISNNKDGIFQINTGSQGSYGRLNGCVCLFDLRHNDFDAIRKTLESHYNFLSPSWFSKCGRKYISWNLAYLFLDQKYYDQIIPNRQVHDHCRETGEYLQAIPKSEVWVKPKLPLSWIEKVLLTTVREPVPDKNTFWGQLYYADHRAISKR